MKLDEWRKNRAGEKYTLPSGLEVTLRRTQILDLAEQGEIPAPLIGMVNNVLDRDKIMLHVEDMQEYGSVINVVVKACLIEPAISEAPDDTHIAIDELSVTDRLAIYNWANEISMAVRPFREEPDGDEGSAPGRGDLRGKTVPDPGD